MFPKHERGVGLASAVFLLMVIAGLIAFMMRMSALQHSSFALDIQGARAFQSARAGIEWGVYRALRDDSCAGSVSFALNADLSDFSVTVQCAETPYSEMDSSAKRLYSIIATACNRPTAGVCPGDRHPYYVERQLQVLVDSVGVHDAATRRQSPNARATSGRVENATGFLDLRENY